MSRVTFPPKLVGETVNLTFDFISRLGSSETISTQSTTCTVYSGVDASPSSVISGAASASGTVVTQGITGGVAGVIYSLKCTITTSLTQTLSMTGMLAVLADQI
jgi:hypothetical protein